MEPVTANPGLPAPQDSTSVRMVMKGQASPSSTLPTDTNDSEINHGGWPSQHTEASSEEGTGDHIVQIDDPSAANMTKSSRWVIRPHMR